MEEAERLCRRIGIIDHGRLLAEGTLPELLAQVQTAARACACTANSPPPARSSTRRTRVREADHVDYVPRRGRRPRRAASARIQQSGLPYDRLEITGPSLETLFLQLTGKELRD